MQDQQDELEFLVLRTLERRPLSLSAIASELLLPPTRVARVLMGLVTRGLVHEDRRPDHPALFRLNDTELRHRVAAS